MARRKQASRSTKTKKHAKKNTKKQGLSVFNEVDTGLLVLFGLVAASTYVAFAPFMFGI